MRRRLALLLLLCLAPLCRAPAHAADVTDATGRSVRVPDRIARVLPAGPPASVLLAALAPDLMLGWAAAVDEDARAWLSPEAAKLPPVPRLTGASSADPAEVARELSPDLILDYGTVSPRYTDLARRLQERTGVPTLLLDGRLAETPRALRLLGAVLHREERAETLARLAEAILALPVPASPAPRDAHPRVLYARGADGLTAVAPGVEATEVFARLGWQVVAPEGEGWFRRTTLEAIRALDPDVLVFSDSRMRAVLADSPEWRGLRAVREGRALVAPDMPFGWIEEPPSLNRLLGLAWLGGHDAVGLAAVFDAVVYGHVPTPAQLDALRAAAPSIPR